MFLRRKAAVTIQRVWRGFLGKKWCVLANLVSLCGLLLPAPLLGLDSVALLGLTCFDALVMLPASRFNPAIVPIWPVSLLCE